MIAVIGAGPAGLACAAMLQRSGQRVVALERGDIGAAWMTRYDRLHLHTVRWLSCLPGYRMPRAFGKWPSRDRVIEYLQRYAEHNALEVRTGVEAKRLDRGSLGWMITTAGGRLETERVIVATGHSNVPSLPGWPGAFGGEIVFHARVVEPFAVAACSVQVGDHRAAARGTSLSGTASGIPVLFLRGRVTPEVAGSSPVAPRDTANEPRSAARGRTGTTRTSGVLPGPWSTEGTWSTGRSAKYTGRLRHRLRG